MSPNTRTRIGVISDTHGLLRPQALEFLRGSAAIIHCGDICQPEVLEQLAQLAPVSAVRGNNDQGAWAQALPLSEILPLGAVHAYVIHDLTQIAIDPRAAGVDIVLSGHSHRPSAEERGGILYLNPGSAGPRRFKLPIAVAELIIEGRIVVPRIQELEVDP